MYLRKKRKSPNQKYDPINKEEVLFLFDVLQDNTIDNIRNHTGYGRDFIRKVLQ